MMQVKDFNKIDIVQRVADINKNGHLATRHAGFENSVFDASVPDNLAKAVLANLLRKQLISGCGCGCRGDFEVTQLGLKYCKKKRGV